MRTARHRTVVALLGGHLLILALAALAWALSAGSSEAQFPVINCPLPHGPMPCPLQDCCARHVRNRHPSCQPSGQRPHPAHTQDDQGA